MWQFQTKVRDDATTDALSGYDNSCDGLYCAVVACHIRREASALLILLWWAATASGQRDERQGIGSHAFFCTMTECR